jgi:hypothetical protein
MRSDSTERKCRGSPAPSWKASFGQGRASPATISTTLFAGRASGWSVAKTRPSGDTATLPGGVRRLATIWSASTRSFGAAVRSGKSAPPP